MSRDGSVRCVRCQRRLQDLAVRNVFVTDEGPTCRSCIDVAPEDDDPG